MPLKTLLYLLLLLGAASGGVFYHPLVAVYGYIATYVVNPAGAWWGQFVPTWASRYSFILGVSAIAGAFIHRSKVEGRHSLHSQEILLILFCLIVWFSHLVGMGPSPDSNALKVTKFAIILLVSARLITNQNRYEGLLWVLIITGLYLGILAYRAPGWMFIHGRLSGGIGGSDFAETNFLAAHFSFLLPLIAAMFLRGKLKAKALCLVAGAFVFNGIVLSRSRGVFLALLVGGASAVFLAKKEIRKKVLIVLIVGAIGGSFLVDPGFWRRAAQIHTNGSAMDASAVGRIEAWKAAIAMTIDSPLGVGEGNFKTVVRTYNPDIAGKDTHNTLLRCMAELGVQGLAVMLLLMVNAFKILSRIRKAAQSLKDKEDILLNVYALQVALVIFFVAGLFITETYIEEFYWLLMMPLFLQRSVSNEPPGELGGEGQKLRTKDLGRSRRCEG